MTIAVTSPITGAAQTGLTSPTYTVVPDAAPGTNAKQYAVTGIGGTQTGVTVSSVSSPFTCIAIRPQSLRGLPPANVLTGVVPNVPNNNYQVITRKGVTPAANQAQRTLVIRTTIDVPAGADTYDAANVRAALSLHIGVLSQQTAGLGDTIVSGII